jgi:hypothetical protein
MPTQDIGIDFIAYDPSGHAVLLAEAKSRRGTSAQWAAQLRSNMLAHGLLPPAKYFLIATPDRMYLWTEDGAEPAEAAPKFTIDAAKEFQPYFEKFHQEPSGIGPQAFDFLVLTWLTDLARSGEETLKQDASLRWLADSGLFESLRQARIEMNP